MPVSFSWDLPADSTAPGQGRWHLRELLSNDTEALDAELVVTELITNAWRHGSGPITLRVELREDCVFLEVCSESQDSPRIDKDPSDSGGRGLLMIEGLTRMWGFEHRGGLLCVWAEISAG